MPRWFTRTLKGVGWLLLILLVVGGAIWGYWGYSPVPDEPALSGVIHSEQMEWDGRERRFIEYIPAGLSPGAPLIVVLHGSVMNGGSMRIAAGYGFDQLADRHRFAVVYPSGYLGHWNDCRNKAKFAAKREQIDDSGFLLALIDRMVQQYQLDPARVFLVGYSNGGHMAFRLGIEAPGRIAGIAVAAASVPEQPDSSCDYSGPTPRVMLVNGTADNWNPYQGGDTSGFGVHSRGNVLSAVASAEHFARRNGAQVTMPPQVLPHVNDNDDTVVTLQQWLRDGAPYVALYSIEGGGHVFPQPVYRFPRMYGLTSDDLNLPQAAVAFFGVQ